MVGAAEMLEVFQSAMGVHLLQTVTEERCLVKPIRKPKHGDWSDYNSIDTVMMH